MQKSLVPVLIFSTLFSACGQVQFAEGTKFRAQEIRNDGTVGPEEFVSAWKFCFEGAVWVRYVAGSGSWGGQQLGLDGKPVPCEEKK